MDVDPTQWQSVLARFKEQLDVLDGVGVHTEHTQKQVGRCVVCSCGDRVQGRMKKPKGDNAHGEPGAGT